MANIPSIPPLLCSTPPPIDFGDDGDEDDDAVLPPSLTLEEEYDGDYNYFAGTPQSTYIETNSDVPSLPRTPVQLASNSPINDCIKIPTTTEDRFSEFQINKEAKTTNPVEAFNFAILESNSPPPLDLDAVVTNEEAGEENFQDFCTASQDSDPGGGDMSDDVEEEYSVIKTEDNLSLPSLKFDTLSISSEKFSACSRSSPSPTLLDDQGNSPQIIQTLADNEDKASPIEISACPHGAVQLEDLVDDSSDDESHSPKEVKNRIEDENADDFFAIHTLNEDNRKVIFDNPRNGICVKKEAPLNQDNLELISSKQDIETNRETENSEERREEKVDFSDFTDFSVFQCTSKSDVKTENGIEEDKPHQPPEPHHFDFEDEFDDFQDFTNAATVSDLEESIGEREIEPEIQNIPISSAPTAHMEDSEDEFGDFSDATFTPAPSVPDALPNQSINIPSQVSSNNLNHKLVPILEMMFPLIETKSEEFNEGAKSINTSLTEDNTKLLKLNTIDTAKALDYHWTKSEVRHSLIRSLGIDSRNILFGDKWNSSIPRFAANLTFNPLEPLKPQQVHKGSDKVHSNAAQRTVDKSKPDVPAVEFDWNTSGLVNPLDGSKEIPHGRETETVHTSQPGTVNASADPQPSHPTIANDGNNDDGTFASNANFNTTTASPAITDPTTTTAISSIISTDSLGYSINGSGNNIDLGASIQIETELLTIPIPVTAPTPTFATTETPYKNTTTFVAENAFNSKKEEYSDNDLDEVVATSTFAGPLKETHIYTPSKQDPVTTAIITKTAPIDFDYEIAAAGIIIDEKVVKKEYRDVEYDPGFGFKFSRAQPSDVQQTNTDKSTTFSDLCGRQENQHHSVLNKSNPSVDMSDIDEEFSDFQYVPPAQLQPSNISKTTQQFSQSVAEMRCKDIVVNNSTPTVGRAEMILSPSILLPQAIPLESNKPKIEWGDTTTNINPEELARIEELFPQPKTEASSHKSTPQHNGYQLQTHAMQLHNSLSISATIAQKEQQVDDDDWTEFVSVPVMEPVHQHQPKSKQTHFSTPNNNFLMTSSMNRKQQLQYGHSSHASAHQRTKPDELTATSEEEWSDFVSSRPQPNTEYRASPQFNSAAWQNANFYNNPLSFYQNQIHGNGVPKLHNNNNNSMNSNYNNSYNKLYQQQDQHNYQQRQLKPQQQIHIMQDFSTAPPSQRRSPSTPILLERNTQFQVGSAKVAPRISLIPDLGFIAPAAPMHTAFINTLPKPSFSMKK